jgi:hypothetical protein
MSKPSSIKPKVLLAFITTFALLSLFEILLNYNTQIGILSFVRGLTCPGSSFVWGPRSHFPGLRFPTYVLVNFDFYLFIRLITIDLKVDFSYFSCCPDLQYIKNTLLLVDAQTAILFFLQRNFRIFSN